MKTTTYHIVGWSTISGQPIQILNTFHDLSTAKVSAMGHIGHLENIRITNGTGRAMAEYVPDNDSWQELN